MILGEQRVRACAEFASHSLMTESSCEKDDIFVSSEAELMIDCDNDGCKSISSTWRTTLLRRRLVDVTGMTCKD